MTHFFSATLFLHLAKYLPIVLLPLATSKLCAHSAKLNSSLSQALMSTLGLTRPLLSSASGLPDFSLSFFLGAAGGGPGRLPPVLTMSWRMFRQGRVKLSMMAGEVPCLAAARKSLTTVLSLVSQHESFCLTSAAMRFMSCLTGARIWSPLLRAPRRRVNSSLFSFSVASALFLVRRQMSAWTLDLLPPTPRLRLLCRSSVTRSWVCSSGLVTCLVARARSRVRQCSTQAVAQP